MAEKQYAVVTRVTPVREGGRTVVHTYGPYTKSRAQGEAQKIKRDAMREGYAHRAEVSVCTLLDFCPTCGQGCQPQSRVVVLKGDEQPCIDRWHQ